ncbi:MAG TPA: tRNA (adenosine(37)-N6)-threonylcarbamoyltransferase complex ATPase subunit type 1 TsaE [Candidatus Polarisedimenticolia bacterium]|nr:tRNA (adenosine(37)-N6)-threonylcarbamoyltransferase complex ATPase subunit type 1 TsaE [Candidatus Polarisedimenticolia bacterium]
MARREILTHSVEKTLELGRDLGARLKPPALILLSGDLGTGKTTLTKGIVSGLGAAEEDQVTSPTFTLVHKYADAATVYHVDLYRVGNFHDLESLGLEDFLTEEAIVIVEWPEKFTLRADWPVVRIHLEHVSEDTRRISIEDTAEVLANTSP